ncbi:MAG: right-handed parallel beta-helix repeat-containing protein [Gammaproteobacteria bacterium]|nr:right-handed parallel beta-helix repeat-containing protein [Gammaproteobacteria bacterium]
MKKNVVKSIRYSILNLFILAGVLFIAPATTVFAAGCTSIVSVPTIITVPGTYCLTSDLIFPNNYGIAIEIQVDDVSLDFKGFELKGPGNNNIIGVYAAAGSNVIIRNGRITNVRVGIRVGSSSIVENMIITNVANQGVIVNPSNASIIRNNVISNITPVADNSVSGILLLNCASGTGTGVRVIDNVVSGFKGFQGGTRLSVGIEVRSCNGVVKGNSLSGYFGDYGIYIWYAGRHLILENNFVGDIAKEIVCGYFAGTVKYKDNLSHSPYGGKYECPVSGDLGGNI